MLDDIDHCEISGRENSTTKRHSIFLRLSEMGLTPKTPAARKALLSVGLSSYLQTGFPKPLVYCAALVICIPHMILFWATSKRHYKVELLWSFLTAIFAGALTWTLIPRMKKYTQKSGLQGKDLCKRGTAEADKPM